jgi:hypothetical protein
MTVVYAEVAVLRRDRVRDRQVIEEVRAWIVAALAAHEHNAGSLLKLGGHPQELPPLPASIAEDS